jgi:hypothetical protein
MVYNNNVMYWSVSEIYEFWKSCNYFACSEDMFENTDKLYSSETGFQTKVLNGENVLTLRIKESFSLWSR